MIASALPPQAAFELPLWPDGAPSVIPLARAERWFTSPPDAPFHYPQVRNVTVPTLTAFLPVPLEATGTAVIVCPGGAHHTLGIGHEGYDVARWLTARGIAAFVLKNRLIPTPDQDDAFEAHMGQLMTDVEALHPLAQTHLPYLLADGQRAMHLVRERASEWGVAPDRIGILGFSAGGHLAALVTLQGDAGSRPAFTAPVYGSMWGDVTVPPDAPPLFLTYANDDPLGDFVIEASLKLYTGWRAAGRPVELHAYTQGGHGFGLQPQGLPSDGWIERFYEWLQAERLLTGS